MTRRRKLKKPTKLSISTGISDQSHTTNAPTSTFLAKKERNISWSTTISLITAIIVGIGGIFATIYSGYQANQTQIKIAELQSELQRNNNFAHLTINNDNKSITVRNSGPNIANGVKITVTLIYINSFWKSYIHNINEFNITVSQPTLISSMSNTTINLQGAEEVTGENATQIAINALAPGASLSINIDHSNLISSKPMHFSTDINLAFREPSQPLTTEQRDYAFGTELVRRYFDHVFEISAFDVDSSCGNCEINSDSYTEHTIFPFSTEEVMIVTNGPSHLINNENLVYQQKFSAEIYSNMPEETVPLVIKPLLNLIAGRASISNPNSPSSFVTVSNASPDFVWPDLAIQCSSCS